MLHTRTPSHTAAATDAAASPWLLLTLLPMMVSPTLAFSQSNNVFYMRVYK
jgi:hypothetical protein